MESTSALQEQLLTIMLTVFGLVVLCAFFVWIMRWLMQRRWALQGAAPTLKVVERMAISPKTTLFVVEADGRSLLLAESSDEVCAVADLSRFRLHPQPPAQSSDDSSHQA
jgi:flagellar biogenesis protein FliO